MTRSPASLVCFPAGDRRVRADEPKWKQHTINGQSEFEAAGVFDVDNDGKLDIVSGDTWYQAPDWKPLSRPRRDAASAPTTTISPRCRSTSTATAIPISSRAPTSARTSAGSRTPGRPARPGPITRSTCRATSRRPGWSTSPATACPTSCPTRSTWSSGTRSSKKGDGKGFELKKHDFGTQAAGHGVGSGDVNGDGRIDLLTPKGWFEAPADPAHDTWAWHPDWKLGATGIQILARDVDGDGLSDVVYGMGHDYGLFWLHQAKGTGGERTWTKQTIDNSVASVHALDLGRHRRRRQGQRAGHRQARLRPRDRAGRDRRLAHRLVCTSTRSRRAGSGT